VNKPPLDSKDILQTANDVIAGIRSELQHSRKRAEDERLLSVNRQIERLTKYKPSGNQTLAEALVTLQLLQNAGGDR
jgi:hypothetical protein